MLLENQASFAVPNDLGVAVALGYVQGWEGFRKFGQNSGVPSGTPEEMWAIGTPRVLPSAAAVVSVVSSDAQDTLTSGTGGWTLKIEGLDANHLDITETINLNGLSAVTTTQEFLRVNRCYLVTAGTNRTNVGNITISISSNTQAYIEASEGQTQQTQYTVPANKSLIVTGFSLGIGRMTTNSDAHIQSEINLDYSNDGAWRAISDIWLYNGQIYRNDNSVTLIPQKTEIKQLISSTSATEAFGVFSGYLVSNNVLKGSILA